MFICYYFKWCNYEAGTLHNLAVGDPVTQEQIVACDAVPVVLAMTTGR
jgi:hypothetical protein